MDKHIVPEEEMTKPGRANPEDSDPGNDSGEMNTETKNGIESGEFHRLDPRAIKLWRVEVLPFVGITSLMAVTGGSALMIFSPVPLLIVPLVWTVLACLFIFLTLWLPPRKYASWSYRSNDQILELRFGIFWQTSVMIPLSRLQHVDMSRGPFERHFGLATLEVHTAGTRAASHKISGMALETALDLRDRLVSAADLTIENE